MLSMFCNVSDSPRAHSSAAADQSFLLSHRVKTQLFWLFFLENFWNILFINSVGSTLVTTHVASHVRPQAFQGWLLSCCVPAQLCEAATAAQLVPQPETAPWHGPGCTAPWPCAALYLPKEHGSRTDLWLPGHGSGLQGGAGVSRLPVPPAGKGMRACHGCWAAAPRAAEAVPSLPGALPFSMAFEKYRVSTQFEEL